MISPCGIEIKVGQEWEEIDPRYKTPTKKYIVAVHEHSELVTISNVQNGRTTIAMLKRFNGKRGGYRLVKEAPYGLQK